jgi:hypothetical protein
MQRVLRSAASIFLFSLLIGSGYGIKNEEPDFSKCNLQNGESSYKSCGITEISEMFWFDCDQPSWKGTGCIGAGYRLTKYDLNTFNDKLVLACQHVDNGLEIPTNLCFQVIKQLFPVVDVTDTPEYRRFAAICERYNPR